MHIKKDNVSENKRLWTLDVVISTLHNKNDMNVEDLSNYYRKNDAPMILSNDE